GEFPWSKAGITKVTHTARSRQKVDWFYPLREGQATAMRVIVDTSVWSLALRRRNRKEGPETAALSALISEGRVVLLGAVRQEILSGVRHIEQFGHLRSALEPFPDETIGSDDYIEAARLCNECLRAGVL